MSSKNETQLKLVLCTPNSVRPTMLGTFIQQMKDQKEQSFHHVLDFSAISEVIQDGKALVVLSIYESDELFGALQFLALMENRIASGLMRIMVISRTEHPRLTTLLKSKGVTEVHNFNLTAKAFHYKVRQALQQIYLHHQESKSSHFKPLDGRTQAPTAPAASLRWLQEIEHASDFWLVQQPKHVRFVIGKWFLNFYGPGPSAGVWREAGLILNGEKGWVFHPRNPDDQTFYKSEGRWIFYGNCPEFSWSLGLWYLISQKPFLGFYEGGQVLYEKAWLLDNGDFGVRKNSKYAQSLQPLIQSTIESSILLKQELTAPAQDASFEKEVVHPTELDGTFGVEESIELYAKLEEQMTSEKKRASEAYDRARVSLAITAKNGVAVRYENCLELVALREHQAILNVPQGLLSIGDQIELEAEFKNGKNPSKIIFKAITRILETGETENGIPDPNARVAAICELDHLIQSHFIELVKEFHNRREGLLDFFKKAKGV
jgi:hypothetical protein